MTVGAGESGIIPIWRVYEVASREPPSRYRWALEVFGEVVSVSSDPETAMLMGFKMAAATENHGTCDCGDPATRTRGGEPRCDDCGCACSDDDGPCSRHEPGSGEDFRGGEAAGFVRDSQAAIQRSR